jgi:hypothetical protein
MAYLNILGLSQLVYVDNMHIEVTVFLKIN